MAVPPEIARALEAIKNGDSATAEQICGNHIQTHPNEASAYHMLGEILVQRGALGDAVPVLANGIALDPSVSKSFRLLGRALSDQGFHQQAAAVFNTQSRRWPNDPDPCFALAVEFAHCFDAERALEAAQRGMSFDKPTAANFGRLGEIQVLLGNTRGAIEAFQNTLALDPRHAFVALTLSELYASIGDGAQADAMYRQAAAYMRKSMVTMRAWIGQVDNRGMKKETFELAQEFCSLFPDDYFGPVIMGGTLAGWGRFEEADTYFERALSLKLDAKAVQ